MEDRRPGLGLVRGFVPSLRAGTRGRTILIHINREGLDHGSDGPQAARAERRVRLDTLPGAGHLPGRQDGRGERADHPRPELE